MLSPDPEAKVWEALKSLKISPDTGELIKCQLVFKISLLKLTVPFTFPVAIKLASDSI